MIKLHGSPYQEAGLPDLMVVVRGRFVGLEVKLVRAGESVEHARARATPLQLAQLDRLARAGALVAVVVSVEEAMTVLAAISQDP